MYCGLLEAREFRLIEATLFLVGSKACLWCLCTWAVSIVPSSHTYTYARRRVKAVEHSPDLSYLRTLHRMSPTSLLFKLRHFTAANACSAYAKTTVLAAPRALPLKPLCVACSEESFAAGVTLFAALFGPLSSIINLRASQWRPDCDEARNFPVYSSSSSFAKTFGLFLLKGIYTFCARLYCGGIVTALTISRGSSVIEQSFVFFPPFFVMSHGKMNRFLLILKQNFGILAHVLITPCGF